MGGKREHRMRVLQVATLASLTGAYGGPIADAQSQAAALRGQAVETVLLAGQRAADPSPNDPEQEHSVDLYHQRSGPSQSTFRTDISFSCKRPSAPLSAINYGGASPAARGRTGEPKCGP